MARMSTTATTPGHAGAVAHHATDDHGDDHGHDDHAHAEEALGPIDVRRGAPGSWGSLLGLAVAAAFVLAHRSEPLPGA